MRRFFPPAAVALAAVAALGAARAAHAEDAALPERIVLPAPNKTGGDLMKALNDRQSGRSFADVELSPADLSDLCWATAGVNREDGRFTYPTYTNNRDMILFVVLKSGVFRYDPGAHALEPVAGGDRRLETGIEKAPWVGRAAVNFVFVQDLTQWREDTLDIAPGNGMIHAGLMMQSAGLVAAWKDWACVVRAHFEAPLLRALLKLPETQQVVITQSVGPHE